MYFIIGGDGKTYGPITETDLRKWMAEGRLNAESRARAESETEFRALGTFPEFADVFGYSAPAPEAASPVDAATDWSTRDYDLDIGGCISRGWNIFTNNLGTLFGTSLVFIVLLLVTAMGLNFVLSAFIPKALFLNPVFKVGYGFFSQAITALVIGPLTGGLYYVFIQKVREQPGGVGDIFVGFERSYLQLVLGHIIFGFLSALCFIPYNLIAGAKLAPVLAQFQQSPAPDQLQAIFSQFLSAWAGTLPILLICLVPATYVMVSFGFMLPLIIDGQMDCLTGLKTSWKMVHKHWWMVFGLFVVTGIITMLGLLACCVGALFTFPIATAAMMCAYETIFGRSRTT